MQFLRSTKLVARLVLVWFGLFLGMAVVSAMLQVQDMQMVCTGAGGMKVISNGDDGKSPPIVPSLHCSLCANVAGPLPIGSTACTTVTQANFAAPTQDTSVSPFVVSSPPPARGPPDSS